MTALLGGHVNAVLANYSEVQEQLQAGKVRALASTSQTRIAPLPDVPSVAELGYKNYNVEVWFGVLAPAKTPKDTVAQLANWFSAAINAPEVTPRLLRSVFIRLALASTTSPHTSVANTTNTAALSARQTLRANSVR
jgi:tripartite-type tricarboxylate transporter receptor subunit TctC